MKKSEPYLQHVNVRHEHRQHAFDFHLSKICVSCCSSTVLQQPEKVSLVIRNGSLLIGSHNSHLLEKSVKVGNKSRF